MADSIVTDIWMTFSNVSVFSQEKKTKNKTAADFLVFTFRCLLRWFPGITFQTFF